LKRRMFFCLLSLFLRTLQKRIIRE
jgi:hypothetical protein